MASALHALSSSRGPQSPSPRLSSKKRKEQVCVVLRSKELLRGDEQTAARLRAKAQPAKNQGDGSKALDETTSSPSIGMEVTSQERDCVLNKHTKL